MTSRKTDNRDFKRRGPSREPKKLVLILCDAEKSEPKYLTAIRTKLGLDHHPTWVVRIEKGHPGYSAKKAIEKAISIRLDRQGPRYEEIWCVFDFDQHPEVLTWVEKAQKKEINIAASNPCFELWYLLHFDYTSRSFTKCSEVFKELKKRIPDYSKNKVPFDDVSQNLEQAIDNATRLKADKHCESFTDVYLLIQSLKEKSETNPVL